jgi:probable HAF family extracellular repeat protein
MPEHSVSAGVIRVSRTVRALLIVSLLPGVGLSVETLGAPWELRIDIPGATFQLVRDISSNGQYAIGFYSTQQSFSNFLWHRGEVSTISLPGAQTTPIAVNARGDVTGLAFYPDTGTFLPFVRGQDGTVTVISCPAPTVIVPAAINNAGTVVGSWENLDETRSAFRWRNGRCEVLPVRAGRVAAADIAENGLIVGSAGAGENEFGPGYGFMVKGDEVITVEHPEAPSALGGLTIFSAVAPNGLVVGWSSPTVTDALHGDLRWFVYRDGVFQSIDVPRVAREFEPLSISPAGVITYEDTDDVIRALEVTTAARRSR